MLLACAWPVEIAPHPTTYSARSWTLALGEIPPEFADGVGRQPDGEFLLRDIWYTAPDFAEVRGNRRWICHRDSSRYSAAYRWMRDLILSAYAGYECSNER